MSMQHICSAEGMYPRATNSWQGVCRAASGSSEGRLGQYTWHNCCAWKPPHDIFFAVVYLWDWFALPLQQVGTKTCVAIVIRVRFISVPIDGQPDTEHADSASLSSVLPEASLSECLVYHVQDEGQGCGHSVEDEQTGGGDTGL